MKKNKKIVELWALFVIFGTLSIISFIQSSDMKINKQVNFNERGAVNYSVYLTDTKYYNTNKLEEGMQYISSIIDYFDINYSYLVEFQDKFDYNLNTKVIADVKIVDKDDNSNVIYSTSDTIKKFTTEQIKDKKYVIVNENVKLDYKKYNKLANDFKSNYGISADCVLVVTLTVDYDGAFDGNLKVRNNRLLTFEVPLSQQMITVNKSNTINNTSSVTATTNKTLLNKVLLGLGVFFAVIALYSCLKIVRHYNKNRKNQSKYEKELRKILRQYDAYITESKSVNIDSYGKNVIKITSFKELLDVRNNVDRAIVYVQINEFTSRFMIIDDDQIYCFDMHEEDYR